MAQTALAVGATAALLATAAPAASAAPTARNGVCELGEFCLYYGADATGSVSDFDGSIANYGSTQPSCYDFKSPGAGQGQCVKNNARSAWNNTTAHVVKVYFNSNYGGSNVTYNPGGKGNLGSLTLENASQLFEWVS
ncbi:peptidase inhibitor family I36 protein [Amycolatopsis sp. NPDC023774]|uniref:peptidase inhibitor family I36 protein n=1 Tax=Amycolatopsis sp. NPDC023774 TaxID=3155015 RepID=UPI0033F6F6C8